MADTLPNQRARPWNKMGWASLACGLLACAPPVAIFGTVLGVHGIRFSLRNRGSGLLPAVFGTLAGFAGIVLLCWLIYTMFGCANSSRQFVRDFLATLERGDLAAARSQCDSTFSAADVASLADQLQKMGAQREVSLSLPMYQGSPDNHDRITDLCYTLDGTVTCERGELHLDVSLIGAGKTYRVHRLLLH
jgi:hypothetical protein